MDGPTLERSGHHLRVVVRVEARAERLEARVNGAYLVPEEPVHAVGPHRGPRGEIALPEAAVEGRQRVEERPLEPLSLGDGRIDAGEETCLDLTLESDVPRDDDRLDLVQLRDTGLEPPGASRHVVEPLGLTRRDRAQRGLAEFEGDVLGKIDPFRAAPLLGEGDRAVDLHGEEHVGERLAEGAIA